MESYSDYPGLHIDRPHPRVLRIRIATGHSHNFMDPELHRSLGRIWREVDADDTVGCALLGAEGSSFSAGGNIKRAGGEYTFEDRARTLKETQDIVYGMINCAKPIVSAVRGWAVGAGLACALLADISVVAGNAKLLDGHTRLGLAAGDHAVMIWPLLCGMARAKYHLLLCETVTGHDAAQMGLVSLAVDEAETDARALQIAERLADGAPTAIRWTKHTLNHWLRQAAPAFDASLALEMLGCFGPDVQEGRAAALEKRPARFHGST